MIKEYNFGKIRINDKEYNYDIEVRSDGKVIKWRRKEGHNLTFDDLQRAVNERAEIIVIGTGCYGVMKISEEVKTKIKNIGIKLLYDKTEIAVEIFNRFLLDKKNVIGFFHLTC
ncbi:MAG TPA: MTH938/NDUFAF3 family protein [bacterium]|nr:MTH938/NDUFAF3 family protein [bacterium]